MIRTRRPKLIYKTLALAAAVASTAQAQHAAYTGFDVVTAPSVAGAPKSLRAESDWLNDAAAIGPIHTVDFESMATGTRGRIHTIAPGVTMEVPYNFWFPDNLELMSGPARYATVAGFNSTSGGKNHMRLEMTGGAVHMPTVTFNFTNPIAAFSLFITGEGVSSDFTRTRFSTTIDAGPPSSVVSIGDHNNPYWPSTVQPNVRFGGLIDPSASFTRVTVSPKFKSADLPWRGSFSFDDVRWVESPVPAPSTLALLGVPIAAAGRRRPRS